MEVGSGWGYRRKENGDCWWLLESDGRRAGSSDKFVDFVFETFHHKKLFKMKLQEAVVH